MYNGGDAAEQIFRVSLNGIETAIKITGAGAKHLAVLLYTILSDQKQTKGRARLSTMLKSGEPQKIFSIKGSDLQTFVKAAKQYGILYHVTKKVRGAPDQFTDIIVTARDAGKVSRVVERFHFANVQTADVKTEILRDRAERGASETESTEQTAPEQTQPEKNETEKLLDEMLGKPMQQEKNHAENPTRTSAAQDARPSEVSSEHSKITNRSEQSKVKLQTGDQKSDQGKRSGSVLSELRQIQGEQRKQ